MKNEMKGDWGVKNEMEGNEEQSGKGSTSWGGRRSEERGGRSTTWNERECMSLKWKRKWWTKWKGKQ